MKTVFHLLTGGQSILQSSFLFSCLLLSSCHPFSLSPFLPFLSCFCFPLPFCHTGLETGVHRVVLFVLSEPEGAGTWSPDDRVK